MSSKWCCDEYCGTRPGNEQCESSLVILRAYLTVFTMFSAKPLDNGDRVAHDGGQYHLLS